MTCIVGERLTLDLEFAVYISAVQIKAEVYDPVLRLLVFWTRFLSFENQVPISAVQVKQGLGRIVPVHTEKAMFQRVREARPKDPDE